MDNQRHLPTPTGHQTGTDPQRLREHLDPLPYPCASSHDFHPTHLDVPGWGWCLSCARCGTVIKTLPRT
jgi:hypothetical protein